MLQRRPWREELEIVDRTMKAISGVTDPEELVNVYWDSISELIPVFEYVALSRRHVEPPYYLVTRSSRFTEHFNPWTQRDRLPKLNGGLLGELAFANRPVIIDDLPARLKPDDPGYFYLQGFERLIALPQYDGGEALNVTAMLLPPGMESDPAAIPILHWQSGLFGRGTQNLVLRNQLAEVLSELDRELQVVGDIQRSLLPAVLPSIPGFDVAAYYQTSARAGGDYYDFFPLAGGGWGLFIADVSGHGTPAAVLMAITHAMAHAQPGTHTPPQMLLSYLNEQFLRSYTRAGTFITAFYAVLDPATRTLTYSRAGHNPPRLVRGDCVISLEETGSLPLGIAPGQVYEQSTVPLERGDLLLLYTDGITEAMPHDRSELFGTDRLDKLLVECGRCSAGECLDRIRVAVTAFAENAPPTDDQTLIAIRCVE
ncbi:MAG: PP2C family protein-serine/threonine phosphatase [Planctomycetes bacterium]|nr:PP2C family protein-serine/threonine phosphatase [Planctomycetota bacterium]